MRLAQAQADNRVSGKAQAFSGCYFNVQVTVCSPSSTFVLYLTLLDTEMR